MYRGLALAWALRHGHESLNNGQSIDYRRNMGRWIKIETFGHVDNMELIMQCQNAYLKARFANISSSLYPTSSESL
jgi:hypothetical protein